MIPVEFLYCSILKTTDCAFLQQIYSITNYLGEQDFFYNLINILITNMSVAILEQQKQQQSKGQKFLVWTVCLHSVAWLKTEVVDSELLLRFETPSP